MENDKVIQQMKNGFFGIVGIFRALITKEADDLFKRYCQEMNNGQNT